ncbi:MAG TPA: ATP-binding protein [Humisphaera sp.]
MPDPSDHLPEADAAAPGVLRLHVTSDTANLARVRKAAEAYAASAGFDEAGVAEVGLVVNEAMANVIRHAYHNEPGRPIEFEAEQVPDPHEDDAHRRSLALRLRIRDWGTGADPATKPIKGYVPGEPGGLGLVCLAAMMDDVRYTRLPNGMLLTMTKRKK